MEIIDYSSLTNKVTSIEICSDMNLFMSEKPLGITSNYLSDYYGDKPNVINERLGRLVKGNVLKKVFLDVQCYYYWPSEYMKFFKNGNKISETELEILYVVNMSNNEGREKSSSFDDIFMNTHEGELDAIKKVLGRLRDKKVINVKGPQVETKDGGISYSKITEDCKIKINNAGLSYMETAKHYKLGEKFGR